MCSSSTSFIRSDSHKHEAPRQKSYWNSAFAWRLRRVWEDPGPFPCPTAASSCLQEEPVILCCARQGRWWPLSVDTALAVGSQGRALKLMHDYSDLFAITVDNSADGDPTHISLRSAGRGHSLSFVGNQFCEVANALGVAGAPVTLELCPSSPDDDYCFHLYASSGSTCEGMSPVYIDQVNHCLVLAESDTGCAPAVFALQTVSSAHLLQEIIDLTYECVKQDFCVCGLNNLLKMQMFAYSGMLNDHSPELQKQLRRRNAEEERQVFLEDNLDFAREQLLSNLAEAGAGATHGLPEECMPDFVGRSWKCELPKALESYLSLGKHGGRHA